MSDDDTPSAGTIFRNMFQPLSTMSQASPNQNPVGLFYGLIFGLPATYWLVQNWAPAWLRAQITQRRIATHPFLGKKLAIGELAAVAVVISMSLFCFAFAWQSMSPPISPFPGETMSVHESLCSITVKTISFSNVPFPHTYPLHI
jgi:hypothetical protein